MALTKDEQRRALAWFKAKIGDRGCPVCGGSSWKVERDAAIRHPGPPRGRSSRAILVTCLLCGHLLFFSAVIARCELDEEHPS